MLNGLIMDYELTIPVMLRRAEQMYYDRQVTTRLPNKSRHAYTYADMIDRTKRLSLALKRLGVENGDRVATFSWNHYQHLEAYFGIPSAGGVLHTLNLRLHPNDLTYIAGHAGDKIALVDDVLWPLFEKFKDQVPFKHVVVIPTACGQTPPGTLNYEELLAAEDPARFDYPDLDERQAACMCYTSGTTGKPKGVLASHRAIVLHSIVNGLADTQGVCERDVVQAVVPMFHANAWGLPFACMMVGAKQVFPGPHLDPRSLLEQIEAERVTLTAGVPTIWLGILQILDENPQAFDLKSLRAMVVGGSAAPPSMIQGFQDRHNLNIVHAWGMTELCPMGTIANVPARLEEKSAKEKLAFRAKQGRPVPLVEVRGRNENGLIPRDGQTMGELEVRGPWIASSYFECPEGAASFTDDGWFRTGDIVAISPDGSIQLQDRAKDVIKSGGEWISSVALENALMGHPAVAEAAVVPVEHPKWAERPLAVVVLKPNKQATPAELIEFLAPSFAKWWLPEGVEFVAEIPRTSAGKFLKSALREQFRDYYKTNGNADKAVGKQQATA
ncbi:MAG TPA: long-chain fatty acid--CoA ligase [Pirellulales bacterium]|nr:long-chain fatty acid--CoA ligase [Pirellulales bacterium]